MSKYIFIIIVTAAIFITSCAGPRAFTKGQYTKPERVILLDDRYNESDMRIMAEALVDSLLKHQILNREKPPVFHVETVTNSTHEHINMKELTDKIRVALIKTGKVLFHDKLQRKTLSDEYKYQSESGIVEKSTAKRKGYQVGSDYIMTGDFSSHVQELGRKKVIYYKLTLNVTNIATGLIVWSDEKEIKKLFKKRAYAL